MGSPDKGEGPTGPLRPVEAVPCRIGGTGDGVGDKSSRDCAS